jgi:hypothetical protein
VQIPSTLLCWDLLFISGVFIPLPDMGSAARMLAHLSQLTYAYDLMNHAVLGIGLLQLWLNLSVLLIRSLLSWHRPYGCIVAAGGWDTDRNPLSVP